MSKTILVAVGGNSLIRAGQRGTIEEQRANARSTAAHIADLAELGYGLVITHGNGPQVGSQLLRSEAGSFQTYAQPLDVCVAVTQGEIGYILQNALRVELAARGIKTPVLSIVTEVLVDGSEPSFDVAIKPIGPFYSERDATRKRQELGWEIKEDAARGYRRIVPSPEPIGIVDIDAIRKCVEEKIIVIAVGGGGIPVARDHGKLSGVEAVIDKDRSSALLASELGIEELVISTDVDFVYRHFATPDQFPIRKMTLSEAEASVSEFPQGSMRPKIEAAVFFLRKGGKRVAITSPAHIVDAVLGCFGTLVVGVGGGEGT